MDLLFLHAAPVHAEIPTPAHAEFLTPAHAEILTPEDPLPVTVVADASNVNITENPAWAVPGSVHAEVPGPEAEVPGPEPTRGDCGLTQLKQCFCVDAAVTIGAVDEDCPWGDATRDYSKCFCVNVNICTRSYVPLP